MVFLQETIKQTWFSTQTFPGSDLKEFQTDEAPTPFFIQCKLKIKQPTKSTPIASSQIRILERNSKDLWGKMRKIIFFSFLLFLYFISFHFITNLKKNAQKIQPFQLINNNKNKTEEICKQTKQFTCCIFQILKVT